MIRSRQDLALAQRVVIKAGTSIVSTPEGYPSLSRMANIVEHAAALVRAGKEVIIVTSGAVGVGRQRLRKQSILRQSMSDLITQKSPAVNGSGIPISNNKVSFNSACAAAGQIGLMSLYETMFNQFDITTSQVLLTAFDFTSPERRRNVQYVISQLLALGIVPLLNENDAVSANQGYQLFGNTFSDNDSLAALVSIELCAQLMILLTDVPGVYDRPPTLPEAQLIDVFKRDSTEFVIGEKSTQGRGGMGAKVDAALRAVQGGVQAVVIAAGNEAGVITKLFEGEDNVGTLFLLHDDSAGVMNAQVQSDGNEQGHIDVVEVVVAKALTIEDMARAAREGGRQLQACSTQERNGILTAIADSLLEHSGDILAANELDLAEASKIGVSGSNLKRLKLTADKIDTLAIGIRSIAAQDEPIGQVLSRLEVAENLELEKITTPIGVLLIIFESRPDCLPQIAALAVRSGNGLLLKGGKEAEHSNAILFSLISNAIASATQGKVSNGVMGLVTSRSDISALLKLDQYIDLVIPRGSSALVKYIKENTKIAVLGHAEGVCHVYVDVDCDENKACRIVVDAKTDYPAACNAAETLLVHEALIGTGVADRLLRLLRSKGVALLGGPRAMALGLSDRPVADLNTEYGDLCMSVEVVGSVEEAVQHIHRYGSGHTECIVTENKASSQLFLQSVDSACVFHNASTRFADGFRFGLGAEVGVSTGRIHARGPVGAEALLTAKWTLTSTSGDGHTVASFSDDTLAYTHKNLPLPRR